MRLNPDLIRDILLTTEELTSYSQVWTFDSTSIPDSLNSYTDNEIRYHLQQSVKSNLIEKGLLTEDIMVINDLTPTGHRFLADMRSDTMWNNTKKVATKLGVKSLDAFIQIAFSAVTQVIKSEFGLI